MVVSLGIIDTRPMDQCAYHSSGKGMYILGKDKVYFSPVPETNP
jgi:hypothetical protein